jgi:hypothetical protein
MPSIKGIAGGIGAVGLGAAAYAGRGLGMGGLMAAGLAGGALFKSGYNKFSKGGAGGDDAKDEAKVEARESWVASDKILQTIYKDIVDIKNHLQKSIIPESQAKEIAIQENARFDEVLKVLRSEGLFMGPEDEGEKPTSFLDKIKSFFNFAKFGGFFAKFLGIMKLGKLWSIMGVAVRLLARFFWPVLLGGFVIWTIWSNWDTISQVWKDTMTTIKDTVFGWMDKIKEAWDKVVDAWDFVKDQWGLVQEQWEKVQNFLSDSLTQLFSPDEDEEEMDLGFESEDETMTHSFVGQDGLTVTFTDEELELQGLKVDEAGRLVSIDGEDADPMEGKDWMVTADGELIIVMPLEPEDESIDIPKEDQFDESMIPTDVPRRATPHGPDESWKDLDHIMSLIEDEQGPRVDEAELDKWIKSGDGMFVTDYQGAADDSWEEVTSYGWKAQAVDKFIDVGDVTPASLTDDTVTDEAKEIEIAQVVANVEAGIPELVSSVLDKDVPGAETQQEKVEPEPMLGPVDDSREIPDVLPQDVVVPSVPTLGMSPGESEADSLTPKSVAQQNAGSGKKQQAGSGGSASASTGSANQPDTSSSIVPSTATSPAALSTASPHTPSVALADNIQVVKKTKTHNVSNTKVTSARSGYHKRHGVMNPHNEYTISTAVI